MSYFVEEGSIVRRIWGDADTIFCIFAGSAAEFALNRAADWLFFTGELPRDPIGRLFSTASYAKETIFAPEGAALAALARIHAIHTAVERRRGQRIPDWAYRDVLYMLIDYSERAFHLLHRPLTPPEQEEVFAVFSRVGRELRIAELPTSYAQWRTDRERHLERDLVYSDYTRALYRKYRRHLGRWRYALFLQAQVALVPQHVRELLRLPSRPWSPVVVPSYRALLRAGLRPLVHRLLLPHKLEEIRQLDQAPALTARVGEPA